MQFLSRLFLLLLFHSHSTYQRTRSYLLRLNLQRSISGTIRLHQRHSPAKILHCILVNTITLRLLQHNKLQPSRRPPFQNHDSHQEPVFPICKDSFESAAANQVKQKSQIMSDLSDPSERSTGETGEVSNGSGQVCMGWLEHKELMETHCPEDLKYYEDRRVGKIEAKAFEEWGDPISDEEAKRLKRIESHEVRFTFFRIDYSHGFSGRGGTFSFTCSSLDEITDEL